MAFDSQSARYADILLAAKAQLVRVFDVDGSVVRIAASDKYDVQVPSVGDRCLVLRSYGPEPDTDSGVGRRARPLKRLLRVYLYYRDSLDQAGIDETALTADDAFYDQEELLVSAFDDWFPLSASNTPLTIEPFHPLNSAEGPPTRKEEDDTGWLRSHVDFEIRYVGRNSTPAP